ncbi:hypothetical protein C3L33_07305, partial [Rhododendron williamsianum]
MATPSSSPPTSPQDPHQNPNPNHHHSSPSQSPSSNPSSSQNPLLQPTSTIPSSNKKPQPSLWSHQETVHLIESYQERWYALKRGPLKASQWEEIAVTIAARCGYDDPSKTAVQCRHKIEKLRKRYRAEKQRPNPRAAWEFFDLMNRLEHGPFPVSARPMAVVQYHNSVPRSRDVCEEDEEEEEEEEEEVSEVRYSDRRNRSESNKRKRKLSGGGGRVSGYLEKPVIPPYAKERIERYESEAEEEDDDDEDEEEEELVAVGGGVGELAAEIKVFAERFIRMEHKKMEMMRETERYRMEMENKRMEMILESQRKIVDTIGRAFGSHNKKFKMAQDS